MVNGDVGYASKVEVIEAVKRIRQPVIKMRIWDAVGQVEIPY